MTYDLHVERIINAPSEAVFAARTSIATEREMTRRADPTADVRGEVLVGRARVAEWGPEDARCRVTQTFLEITEQKIVYAEVLEVPPSPVYTTTITETITPHGDGQTLFRFDVEGFPTEEERDLHREGYGIVLDRLVAYLG